MAAAGLEPRVTLVESTIQDFDDPDGFDLVWLPSFFVPEARANLEPAAPVRRRPTRLSGSHGFLMDSV